MPSLRQERAAETLDDPAYSTKKDALVAAGYSPVTAMASAARVLDSAGLQRARKEKRDSRADSASGLMATAQRFMERGEAHLEHIEPHAAMALGLKAAEVAANLGESVTQTGSADAHKRWKATFRRRCYRAGFRAALEGRDPLGLVVSQVKDDSCDGLPPNTAAQVIANTEG